MLSLPVCVPVSLSEREPLSSIDGVTPVPVRFLEAVELRDELTDSDRDLERLLELLEFRLLPVNDQVLLLLPVSPPPLSVSVHVMVSSERDTRMLEDGDLELISEGEGVDGCVSVGEGESLEVLVGEWIPTVLVMSGVAVLLEDGPLEGAVSEVDTVGKWEAERDEDA